MTFLQKIGYACLFGLLWLVALLPLGVLYLFADIIFVLVFHVVRYRRRLVRHNLALCFPEKTDGERRAIERRFYRNFADYIVETVKLLHISDSEMERRFVFSGMDTINGLLARKKSITAYFSHCGNWEWAPSVTLHSSLSDDPAYAFCQIYRPLRSPVFDRLMLHVRSRFGSVSLAKYQSFRDLLRFRRDGITTITGFMSDQKPSHGDAVHVVTFLNRPTAVITGTETVARRLGMAVVYWDMHKVSRGHYRIDVRLMSEDASATEQYELTDRYFGLLQETIRRNPSIWLWTHNRWKNPIPQNAD